MSLTLHFAFMFEPLIKFCFEGCKSCFLSPPWMRPDDQATCGGVAAQQLKGIPKGGKLLAGEQMLQLKEE
jgi:hypothetical protein